MTFTAVVTQRGNSATKTVTRAGRVEAKSYALSHWVHFNAGSTTVTRAEGRYLESVRTKITGATRVTCTGHAAESTRARSVAAAKKRAAAACGALTKNSRAKTVIRTVVEKAATKATATAKARQRRVDVTITN